VATARLPQGEDPRCPLWPGHGTARRGRSVILFKDNGSLCVHAEKGYKPLNYNLTKARGW